ncbi:MAG: hypothetical protein ACRD1T_12785 [Acidimicrobiia bacterium]
MDRSSIVFYAEKLADGIAGDPGTRSSGLTPEEHREHGQLDRLDAANCRELSDRKDAAMWRTMFLLGVASCSMGIGFLSLGNLWDWAPGVAHLAFVGASTVVAGCLWWLRRTHREVQ